MAEKTWLLFEPDFVRDQRIGSIDKEHVFLMMKLAVCTANKPFVSNRQDIVPCDAEVLAAELETDTESVKDAVNAFYKAGLIKKITEKTLKSVVHGAVECRAPSLEEVAAFVAEHNLNVDAARFYEYYSASKFKYRGQIMDWRSKLAEWAETERPKKSRKRWSESDYAYPTCDGALEDALEAARRAFNLS